MACTILRGPLSRFAHRPIDALYFVYFLTHIPITLCVDVMPLLPVHMVPQPMLYLNAILRDQFKDPFMQLGHPRPDLLWFRSILAVELVVQLPYFFYALWSLWVDSPTRHLPMVVYGSHVATTVVPIAGTILFVPDRTCMEKISLLSIYLPYLFIPLFMTAHMFIKCRAGIAAMLEAKTKQKSD